VHDFSNDKDFNRYRMLVFLYLRFKCWKTAFAILGQVYTERRFHNLTGNPKFLMAIGAELQPILDQLGINDQWMLDLFRDKVKESKPGEYAKLFEIYLKMTGRIRDKDYNPQGRMQQQDRRFLKGAVEQPTSEVAFEDVDPEAEAFIKEREEAELAVRNG